MSDRKMSMFGGMFKKKNDASEMTPLKGGSASPVRGNKSKTFHYDLFIVGYCVAHFLIALYIFI